MPEGHRNDLAVYLLHMHAKVFGGTETTKITVGCGTSIVCEAQIAAHIKTTKEQGYIIAASGADVQVIPWHSIQMLIFTLEDVKGV